MATVRFTSFRPSLPGPEGIEGQPCGQPDEPGTRTAFEHL
jgi:hypothetical protein